MLASKGSSGGQNQDAVAIAPYTAVQDQLTGESQSFTELLVQGKSSSTLTLAQSEVENILAAQNDTTVANLPFQVLNQASLLSTATSTTSTLTLLLGAVAAISLLVGGIGVMNIMLVSVTERTREIGIRKAIGAPKLAILSQFLIEAVVISLLGGAVGVGIGLIGSQIQDRRRPAGRGAGIDRAGLRSGHRRRGVLRLLPCQPRRVAPTHRRPAIRVDTERRTTMSESDTTRSANVCDGARTRYRGESLCLGSHSPDVATVRLR